MTMREEAEEMIRRAIRDVQPDEAVNAALRDLELPEGRVVAVAFGKAAWQMAKAASDALGDKLEEGIVITKYEHSRGEIPGFQIFEAGHPVPDGNSFQATARAVALTESLTAQDLVLLLISGGGSALFELPLCSEEDLRDVTKQLLACGASIGEINMIRKRLSRVKGGRFARMCLPARVFAVVLSDVLGDRLDMIASGPAWGDPTTCAMCRQIVEKYGLEISEDVRRLLEAETPKRCENVTARVTGSVRELCASLERSCREFGYEPRLLTASLDCEAKEAGAFLAAIARDHQEEGKSVAYIAGGETVVRLTGKGLGGRNQELALAAAAGIGGLRDTAVFSVGSDGTDGPTDAAGGYVDENTAMRLEEQGISIARLLRENDSYHGLERCEGLIRTGPTGTNVNDAACLLIRRK